MSTSRYSPVRERIAHTQQRQISERAPRPLTAMNGKKTAKKKQRPLLIELFDILPARWKGITLGLLLSLAPSYLISLNTTGDARLLSIAPIFGFILIGFIVGLVAQNFSNN